MGTLKIGLGDVYMSDYRNDPAESGIAICEECLDENCPGHQDKTACQNACIVCGRQFTKFRVKYVGPEAEDSEPACEPCMKS